MPGRFYNVWIDKPGMWHECADCRERVEGLSGMRDHQCPTPRRLPEAPPHSFCWEPHYADARTVQEVVWQKTRGAAVGGCCNRFADNQGCDCLSRAFLRQYGRDMTAADSVRMMRMHRER